MYVSIEMKWQWKVNCIAFLYKVYFKVYVFSYRLRSGNIEEDICITPHYFIDVLVTLLLSRDQSYHKLVISRIEKLKVSCTYNIIVQRPVQWFYGIYKAETYPKMFLRLQKWKWRFSLVHCCLLCFSLYLAILDSFIKSHDLSFSRE